MKKRILQTITASLLCQVLSFPVAYGAPPKKMPPDKDSAPRWAAPDRLTPAASSNDSSGALAAAVGSMSLGALPERSGIRRLVDEDWDSEGVSF